MLPTTWVVSLTAPAFTRELTLTETFGPAVVLVTPPDWVPALVSARLRKPPPAPGVTRPPPPERPRLLPNPLPRSAAASASKKPVGKSPLRMVIPVASPRSATLAKASILIWDSSLPSCAAFSALSFPGGWLDLGVCFATTLATSLVGLSVAFSSGGGGGGSYASVSTRPSRVRSSSTGGSSQSEYIAPTAMK